MLYIVNGYIFAYCSFRCLHSLPGFYCISLPETRISDILSSQVAPGLFALAHYSSTPFISRPDCTLLTYDLLP